MCILIKRDKMLFSKFVTKNIYFLTRVSFQVFLSQCFFKKLYIVFCTTVISTQYGFSCYWWTLLIGVKLSHKPHKNGIYFFLNCNLKIQLAISPYSKWIWDVNLFNINIINIALICFLSSMCHIYSRIQGGQPSPPGTFRSKYI